MNVSARLVAGVQQGDRVRGDLHDLVVADRVPVLQHFSVDDREGLRRIINDPPPGCRKDPRIVFWRPERQLKTGGKASQEVLRRAAPENRPRDRPRDKEKKQK